MENVKKQVLFIPKYWNVICQKFTAWYCLQCIPPLCVGSVTYVSI